MIVANSTNFFRNSSYSKTISTLCVFLLLISLCFFKAKPTCAAQTSNETPQRILSITPAGTEILFDLGLGDRVVGVTKYCSWPPEARKKTNIGDMMQVNLEVIVGLKPDLVLLSNMNEHLKAKIAALGYPVVVVNQDNFGQICDSMVQVGKACGIADHAAQRVHKLREEVKRISSGVKSNKHPRVLVVVGRDISDRLFRKVYVAGKRSFYNDLLGEAKAFNAFDGDVQYALVSREGLIRMKPDIIIELLGEHGGVDMQIDAVAAQWRTFGDLKAAQTGNVALLKGDFTLRAGPRYPLVLGAFIRAIYGGAREIEG